MGETGANVPGSAATEVETLTRGLQSGANWFYWIAAFSVINSLVLLFKGEWGFIIGMGVTQIFDAFAKGFAEAAMEDGAGASVGTTITAFVLVVDVVVASVVALFGWLANKGFAWAFVIGMVFYALDGLLFLLVGDLLSLGFHAFALFCIFGGYSSLKKLRALQAQAGAAVA